MWRHKLFRPSLFTILLKLSISQDLEVWIIQILSLTKFNSFAHLQSISQIKSGLAFVHVLAPLQPTHGMINVSEMIEHTNHRKNTWLEQLFQSSVPIMDLPFVCCLHYISWCCTTAGCQNMTLLLLAQSDQWYEIMNFSMKHNILSCYKIYHFG